MERKSTKSLSDATVMCVSCGGSLPLGAPLCRYCNTQYDADLIRLEFVQQARPADPRTCSHCKISMTTLQLNLGGPFCVERCHECLSLFFDRNELPIFLERVASPPAEVDVRRVSELLIEVKNAPAKVSYLPCPVCSKQMLRKNYGSRSGVVIDSCYEHGMWLEAGELAKLVRWSKLGGAAKPCPLKAEKARLKKELEKLDGAKRKQSRDFDSDLF